MTNDPSDNTASAASTVSKIATDTICVEHCGVILSLSPERCIYLPASDKLILSDVHLGKEAVFQRHGLAIPDGIAMADIDRIDRLLRQFKPQEILILGDLVHALPQIRERWLSVFAHLVENHPTRIFRVVTGNHDKPGTRQLLPAVIQWHEEIFEDNLHFTHFPSKPATQQLPSQNPDSTQSIQSNARQIVGSSANLRFAGHIHPSYVLRMRGKSNSLRMPVYWFSGNQVILPAFGEFTGTHNITPDPGDRIYGVGPDTVLPIPVSVAADNTD